MYGFKQNCAIRYSYTPNYTNKIRLEKIFWGSHYPTKTIKIKGNPGNIFLIKILLNKSFHEMIYDNCFLPVLACLSE